MIIDFIRQVDEMNAAVKGRSLLAFSVRADGTLCLEFEGGVAVTCDLGADPGETARWIDITIPGESNV